MAPGSKASQLLKAPFLTRMTHLVLGGISDETLACWGKESDVGRGDSVSLVLSRATRELIPGSSFLRKCSRWEGSRHGHCVEH